MKCYVINLDRSPDRMSWFDNQVAAHGLRFERVAAVDGDKLPAETIEIFRHRNSGRYKVGLPEIGCLLSHRSIWEMVAESADRWCFIAEDDFHFAAGIDRFLTSDDWLPADIDVVKAETDLRLVALSAKPVSVVHGHTLRRMRSMHLGTGGYFLSQRGARRLLEYSGLMCEPVDQIIFSPLLGVFTRLDILQVDPALGTQEYRIIDKIAGSKRRMGTAPIRFVDMSGAQVCEARGAGSAGSLDLARYSSVREFFSTIEPDRRLAIADSKRGGLSKLWFEMSRPLRQAKVWLEIIAGNFPERLTFKIVDVTIALQRD